MDEPQGCIDTVVNGLVVTLKVECHSIIESGRLAQNVATNIARDTPRFTSASGLANVKREPLAVVSCGHSLNEQLDALREFSNILVCGSAHDHLVRAGIIPTYAVVSDAGVDDKLNLSLPNHETLYLIASQCDPSLFDHLAGHRVEMWHYKGQAAANDEEEAVLLRGEPAIAWGSSVSINAVHIGVLLGHQDLHFFGFDNCYSRKGSTHHACEINGGVEYQKVPIEVGANKRLFISNLALMAQVEQFFKVIEAWREWVHITLHGDGLPHEMCVQGDPGLEKFISVVR